MIFIFGNCTSRIFIFKHPLCITNQKVLKNGFQRGVCSIIDAFFTILPLWWIFWGNQLTYLDFIWIELSKFYSEYFSTQFSFVHDIVNLNNLQTRDAFGWDIVHSCNFWLNIFLEYYLGRPLCFLHASCPHKQTNYNIEEKTI